MGGDLRKLLMGRAAQGVAARFQCPAVEEQAEGLVPSLRAAALLVGPPWVVANDVWSERWRGDWELVLLGDRHVGVLVPVLPMVPVLVLPMVQVLVLLVYR